MRRKKRDWKERYEELIESQNRVFYICEIFREIEMRKF